MLQNERELLAALETLQDYIRSGMDTAASDDVQALQLAAFQIAQMNAKRALLRSRYFSSPSDQLKQSLVQISQEIVVKAEQLNQLPLLGIMVEEEEDEFSAMMGLDSDSGDSPAKVADKGDQITDDIYYLTQRYVPELEQTARQVQLGESAKKQVGQLTAALEARVLESKQYIDQIRTDAENRVITLLIVFLGLLFITGAISALLQFRVLSGMRVVSVYIEKLRSGDFSERLENTMGFTELYELLDCANQLQRYLNQLVSETRQEVDKVQQVSGAIGELAEEIQTGTAEQLARSDETIEAIGSLLASFKSVAEHAVEASSSANEGHNFMHNSAAVMQSLEVSVGEFAEEVEQGVSTIQRLQADSHNIETVLNAIVSIARQTNLLALNASIEAAKAGEQGRGFAVVADEVRMLSARTSEAAQEIRSMIDELRSSSDQVAETMLRQQQQAEHSVVQSERAGAVLQKVMQSITNISHMNNKISEATEKQSSSVDGVQACVCDIQDRTREASERSEQARNHSAQLAEVSLGLSQLVKRYTI
ncbi:methyl-accepting chemotaxis sensory transducer [gamma proteobacterium IMCC2047]|nr:methyl-accepting chemotaxis sensory transducer [gamma proteobacterium IMCC2047]